MRSVLCSLMSLSTNISLLGYIIWRNWKQFSGPEIWKLGKKWFFLISPSGKKVWEMCIHYSHLPSSPHSKKPSDDIVKKNLRRVTRPTGDENPLLENSSLETGKPVAVTLSESKVAWKSSHFILNSGAAWLRITSWDKETISHTLLFSLVDLPPRYSCLWYVAKPNTQAILLLLPHAESFHHLLVSSVVLEVVTSRQVGGERSSKGTLQPKDLSDWNGRNMILYIFLLLVRYHYI